MVSLPKTSSGVTEYDSCDSGRRDGRGVDSAIVRRTILTEIRASLEAEKLVLRQQVIVLNRKFASRMRLGNIDWLTFVWRYRFFPSILNAITLVKPETVIRRHRRTSIDSNSSAVHVRSSIRATRNDPLAAIPMNAGCPRPIEITNESAWIEV